MSSYKLLNKIIIYGKKKLIYSKKNSRKLYCKYNGSMTSLSNYKKIHHNINTNKPKSKLKSKPKSKTTKSKITTKSKYINKFFGGTANNYCTPQSFGQGEHEWNIRCETKNDGDISYQESIIEAPEICRDYLNGLNIASS